MNNSRALIGEMIKDLRSSWKSLALTDVAYKIVAFIILTPLVGILFRVLIAVSGKTVLADQDILYFFLGPVGWFCFIAVGAIWLGILALEQTALLGIICAARGNRRMSVIGALRYAAGNAGLVIRVTSRLVALTLLTIAPFLLVAGLTYAALLTEFDINYYLQEKPPAFLAAVAIGGVIGIALVAVLLRLITSWFFALPLVLFEDVEASAALATSRARTTGRRKALFAWIVGWLVTTSLVSVAVTSLIVFLGSFFVPHATGSLNVLLLTVGIMLVLLSLVNLIISLISTTTFASMLFHLYRQFGSQGNVDPARLAEITTAAGDSGFRFTRGRLLAAGVVGGVLALLVGTVAVLSVRLEDRTDVTAHRGASASAPENTLAAIKQAIEDGADWVEIDVQETADGEVVVFHDSDFMKLAGRNLKIWDATMSDLEEIDIGSWFAPEFSSERVPTLGQVLETCRGKAGVNIELKYYGHDVQLEQRVAKIVESHGMQPDIVVMSLKSDAVKKMKSLRPDWKVGLLMSVSAGDLNKLDADFLAVNAGFVSRSFIRSAHSSGKQVYVWTVNDAWTMSNMISCGVDSLITDEPALARAVLVQRAELSAPERLLLELAGLLGVESKLGDP